MSGGLPPPPPGAPFEAPREDGASKPGSTLACCALALVAPFLLSAAGPAVGEAPPVVRLGTGTPGGGFEAYGEAVARAIAQADPSLRVRPVATGGTAENVRMVAEGRLELGLATGEGADEVLHPAVGPPRVRVLSVTYPSPGLFGVRPDSPYHRIEDLVGQPVVFGVRGSGLVVLAGRVLDGLGLDMERDFRPILLERASEAPLKLLSGEASALWGGGTAWPPFRKLAGAPPGLRFVAPDPDQIRRITARHPSLKPMSVPARSYPGQAEPIRSVGTWGLILVRGDLPVEVVERLARALHRGHGSLTASTPQGRETTMANTAVNVPRDDLHPGARRLLAELRLLPR